MYSKVYSKRYIFVWSRSQGKTLYSYLWKLQNVRYTRRRDCEQDVPFAKEFFCWTQILVAQDLIGLSSEKTYVDALSKTGKVSNLVNGPIPWNGPPRIGNIFKLISEFRIKRCGMDPPRSDIQWKFLEFYFSMYCLMMHANLP